MSEVRKDIADRCSDLLCEQNRIFISEAALRAIPYSLIGSHINDNRPHGVSHWARVACYGNILYRRIVTSTVANAEFPLYKAIMVAGICHDLGRLTEGLDISHGERGALRAALAMQDMRDAKLIPADDLVFSQIIHAVIHHCDDTHGDSSLSRILKDADKLDLIRLGADRLNVNRLYYRETLEMVEEVKLWSKKEWEFPDGLYKP